MALGDEKVCAHCGKDLTGEVRHLINSNFDFPGTGRRTVDEGSWVNLCSDCYIERRIIHRNIDHEFLNLGQK